MTPPKGYVIRTPYTMATTEMLRILVKTGTKNVREKAESELRRRRQL